MNLPAPPQITNAQEFTPTVISRPAAAAAGLKFFYTGRPCIHQHVARRYVSTGGCTLCQREHSTQHSKLYRTLRVQRAIQCAWFIVEGDDEALMATARETIKMLGLRVKEMPRGPQEQMRMSIAPADWRPPQELVSPVLTQSHVASLPSGMGAVEYQHIGELVETPTPMPPPVPPHLLPKP